MQHTISYVKYKNNHSPGTLMKVLVTGAAGFIGSHVVRQLLARGYQVRAMHLPSDSLLNLQGQNAELCAADICDRDSLRRAMTGCDAVIHLAAIYALWLPDPELMYRVNVEGSRNVFQLAAELKIKRIVFTSSIARFGGQGPGISGTEQSPFALAASKDPYPISKAEAHEIAVAAAAAGQDIVICAPTGPIGPGDIGPTPTGKLILTAATLPVIAAPDTITNFGDVRDIALGHVLALEKGVSGESYLLGSENLSALQLTRMAMDILEIEKPVFAVPFSLAAIAGHGAEWISEHVLRKPPLVTPGAIRIARLGLAADCSKAVKELGLPQTPIKTAMTDALIWFAENNYIRNARLKQRIAQLNKQRLEEQAA